MKIAFLHGKGTDYFLQGIVEELSARHEVRVSDTTDMDAIQALSALGRCGLAGMGGLACPCGQPCGRRLPPGLPPAQL